MIAVTQIFTSLSKLLILPAEPSQTLRTLAYSVSPSKTAISFLFVPFLCLLSVSLSETGSLYVDCPEISYIDQGGLKVIEILLLLPPKC